ncbi:hypothetical protein L228DRAFT_37209 [Xylona heveae TC161]|uniref:UBR-type domain-containing protein n=1 Tax=Xylona heveae (strain CBS 132557 / TC161) TaxID=1328760 RepID=A0A164ZWH6_XYLHT|nr:hypothetical protein L228DRAFT_37209 [Xylona heveae TC161]KZF19620.1 hypothetical protein L228DRAFT_37209 [Xylona heveae TC161]
MAHPAPSSDVKEGSAAQGRASRTASFSNASEDSQTAAEYITNQLRLEADAREALPYAFDTCTKPLGPLRQSIFSCLTCNPPLSQDSQSYSPAGVCYSCSISCHGEHELVELFCKRNFVCDCGTTRIPATSPCSLRLNSATGTKGGVHSEEPAAANVYNKNFKNRFCGCGEEYDAEKERGTMFQCLGLGSEKEGGCGEDWWHPECVLGLERQKPATKEMPADEATTGDAEIKSEIKNEANEANAEGDEDDAPLPPGFPAEDDFESFICYKCVESNPWIKRYAGMAGFLGPVFKKDSPVVKDEPGQEQQSADVKASSSSSEGQAATADEAVSKKRKAEDQDPEVDSQSAKKPKNTTDDQSENQPKHNPEISSSTCRYQQLPAAPTGTLSLFVKEDFRDQFCRCKDCFPQLAKFPQLLEEEDSYEPPLSESGDGGNGSAGTGSLLDRGEAALSNMDRVRAIEGVMVYNHLKDKVKSFLQPFAESGQAVGAEDIKKYFEKLRGDTEAIKAAGGAARSSSSRDGGDHDPDGEQQGGRKQQSGY